MTYERTSIVDVLRLNVCNVTFTKVNGDVRVMRCTLREDLLPKRSQVTQNPVNQSIIGVFDLDKDDFRSFRVDSVTNVEIENEEQPTVVS